MEKTELEARHVGRVVRTEVVGLHETDEDAEGFFVGHLRVRSRATDGRARGEREGGGGEEVSGGRVREGRVSTEKR